jgi:hypothetical protein
MLQRSAEMEWNGKKKSGNERRVIKFNPQIGGDLISEKYI